MLCMMCRHNTDVLAVLRSPSGEFSGVLAFGALDGLCCKFFTSAELYHNRCV